MACVMAGHTAMKNLGLCAHIHVSAEEASDVWEAFCKQKIIPKVVKAERWGVVRDCSGGKKKKKRMRWQGNRVDSFISTVEDIFNCQITGTPEQPGQFVLVPTQKPDGGKKTDTEIAIIGMANDCTVKTIDNMECLINLCIPEEEVEPRRKMLWT
eukprot:scaffold4490_cov46-Attheya_sp.AAC.6